MEKIISTNNKSLLMVGVLLLGIATILIINSITQFSPTQDYIHNNLHLGVIGILAGAMFIIFGRKKKYIIFYEYQFSYKISKRIFNDSYSEINLIRTFIDTNNYSKNLMIYFDDNKCLSFSSSFWTEEKLIEAYKEFINRSNEFINKNEISIENNLNW